MSHIISLSSGEIVDIDTFGGQYAYVAHYLATHGADSQTFSCLSKMKTKHDCLVQCASDIYIPEPKC